MRRRRRDSDTCLFPRRFSFPFFSVTCSASPRHPRRNHGKVKIFDTNENQEASITSSWAPFPLPASRPSLCIAIPSYHRRIHRCLTSAVLLLPQLEEEKKKKKIGAKELTDASGLSSDKWGIMDGWEKEGGHE